MEWTTFIKTLHEAERRWKEIQAALPEYKDYLKTGGLFITHQADQLDFKKDIDAIGMQHYLKLIQPSAMKDGLAYLFDQLKKNTEEKSQNKDAKQEIQIEIRIAAIKSNIAYFPIECLEMVDDFNIEIAFSTLVFDAIQALKSHPLVNAAKTCECTVCIRVYLY